MVRKNEAISLGEAIKEFLSQYKHSGKLQENEAINAWPKVMGKNIAALTLSVGIKGGKLIVKLKSSVLRNELMMHRSKIVAAINQQVGSKVIKDVVLM